jgi:CRISPR-associated protein Csx3
MVNLLPAVIFGGPPHAGKSVLFYSLTQALRERGIRHHAIRACPDGEGNWSQESKQETVSQIRKRGQWSDSFVQRVSQDLEHRCLPFLVDMGGRPQGSQMALFRLCTHSILLVKDDEPALTMLWDDLVTEHALEPLARVRSCLEGKDTLEATTPTIQGTITSLVREKEGRARGEVFNALLERVAALFNSYSPQDLERVFFEQAPSELLNLYEVVPTKRWQPEMLPALLTDVPQHVSLSVYGAAPNWVYAALAAHTDPQPFYQFDPRLPFGWIQPLSLQTGTEPCPQIQITVTSSSDTTILSVLIPSKHLEYFQPDPLMFPSVPPERGLILSGVMPYWLLTALVRLYKRAGVAWIASYQVPLEGAVIVFSHMPPYVPGDLIPITVP